MSTERERRTEAAARVRVLWPDHLGIARGKYVPTRTARGVANFCVGVFSQHYDRTVSLVPGAGFDAGFPDVEARYDLAEARAGWEPHTQVVIADLYDADGPLAVSPRHALRRAVDAWRSIGYEVDIGIELEAFVLEPDENGGWRPWATPGGYVYGTGPLADPAGLFDEILEAAERSELGIESVTCESTVPQFEIAVEHGEALDSIDRTFLIRQLAREIAQQRGLLLTFMGRPFVDLAGSGMHINVSVRSPEGNGFSDPSSDDGLSELCRRALNGLVEHHVGMTALCAPTVNAYKRLQPGLLSGYWANWGYDHRAATNRVPPHRGAGTRIENRLPDGAANPYIASAAVLWSTLLGQHSGGALPPPEQGDGIERVSTDIHAPEDLARALDALEEDDQLVDAVGAELVANFVAIKRSEWRRFMGAVTDWELDQYLWMT